MTLKEVDNERGSQGGPREPNGTRQGSRMTTPSVPRGHYFFMFKGSATNLEICLVGM